MNAEDAVATLKRHAEPWGVYLNDPCSVEALSTLTRGWERALTQRRPVRHAWLGTGDSVDQCVYDYASARFNVARLGLDDQVFESFADLGSMLLFLGNG